MLRAVHRKFLRAATAEEFAKTINSLKGRVSMIFITHALPKALQVDAVVRLGEAPKTAEAGGAGKDANMA